MFPLDPHKWRKGPKQNQNKQQATNDNILKFHLILMNQIQDILKKAYLGTKHDLIWAKNAPRSVFSKITKKWRRPKPRAFATFSLILFDIFWPNLRYLWGHVVEIWMFCQMKLEIV